MGAVERFDRGSLRSPKATPQGFLRAEMYATRTGVFEYPKADGGVVREYRDPSEVFHPDSLASYQDASFTDDHPQGEMVTAENVTKYERGTLTAAGVPDGDHVKAPVVVKDKATIAKMQAGKQEVSCGYTCDLVWEPGVSPQGVKYDARQTNIRINHVALVDVGRAGPTARVRMDGAGVLVTGAHDSLASYRGHQHRVDVGRATEPTMKFAIHGLTFDVAEDIAKAIDAERADAAKALDLANAKADAATDKATKAEKERTDALEAAKLVPAQFDAAVKARVALVVVAEQHEVKHDGLSDRAVKAAVVEKLSGRKVTDAHSNDYVTALYDAACEDAAKASASLGAARAAVTGAAMTDAAPPLTAAQAHAEMVARNRNDWKPKEN